MKKLGKKALDILKGIAPLAASAIGGPFAGAAISIIAEKLGVDPDNVEDYILSANPDQLLVLKQAELALDQWRIEAGIRKDELEAADRDSARGLAKEKGLFIQGTLTFLFVGGYLTLMYLFFRGEVLLHLDEFGKGQLGILIGVLTAAVPQILGFWFGSSRGSKEKTDILGRSNQ